MKHYCIWNSFVLFKEQSYRLLAYNTGLEKFHWLGDESIANIHLHGEIITVNTSGSNGNRIIITDLIKEPVIIPNAILKCSCQYENQILILTETNRSNQSYYDLARKTVIDVGNFVCWLPDSLSFFENQTIGSAQACTSTTILKRFSRESTANLDDKCIVCWEPFINKIALIPCGHTQLCEKCASKVDGTCLLCKQKFTSVMKIFL